MAMDRRKRRIQAKQSRRRGSVLLLLVAIVLILTCLGALWATSGFGAGSSASPTALALLPQPPAQGTPTALAATTATVAGNDPPPAAVSDTPKVDVGTEVGQAAPEFTLKDLSGAPLSLGDLRGKVVLLNFWATWCGPCRNEIPDLRVVYDAYKEGDFTVLAVDLGETAGTVSKFASDFDMQFPILLDSNLSVGRQYGIFSIPTSFFVDRQGIIREVHVGSMTQSYIEQMLSELLKES